MRTKPRARQLARELIHETYFNFRPMTNADVWGICGLAPTCSHCGNPAIGMPRDAEGHISDTEKVCAVHAAGREVA